MQVTHPGGSGECQALVRQPLCHRTQRGWRQTLRDFLRAVGGDLVHAVLQRRVGETREQSVAVGGPVGASHLGPYLLSHQASDESVDVRIADAVADHTQARHGANAGHGRVAGVEQAQLGFFKGRYVFDHRHAGAGQHLGVSGVAEFAFDHPFPKTFSGECRAVGCAQGGLCAGQGFGAGGGHDAIHHAVRKGAVGADPGGHRFVAFCSGQAQGFELVAVVREVVAGGDGQAARPSRSARGQTFRQQARQLGRVTFFSDGQCDPAGVRRCHGLDHFAALSGQVAGLPDCAADLPGRPCAAGGLHGVQALLRIQRGLEHGAAHRHDTHAPTRVAALQKRIKHQRLVRPVKGPQSQMQHTDGAASGVARPLNGRCKCGQCVLRQTCRCHGNPVE